MSTEFSSGKSKWWNCSFCGAPYSSPEPAAIGGETVNETVWTHREKKWKPRNKQAALITRKASELLLHTPPQESRREPTLKERLEAESAIRKARISAIEAEAEERRKRRELQQLANSKPPKPRKAKNMWAARMLRQQRKSRGLPPPTTEELRAFRKAQPGYGKPLFTSNPTTIHPDKEGV